MLKYCKKAYNSGDIVGITSRPFKDYLINVCDVNENKIIYKQGKSWMPYANIDKTWYKLIAGSNNEHSYSQLKFSPKGVYEISKILNIEFEEEDLNNLK